MFPCNDNLGKFKSYPEPRLNTLTVVNLSKQQWLFILLFSSMYFFFLLPVKQNICIHVTLIICDVSKLCVSLENYAGCWWTMNSFSIRYKIICSGHKDIQWTQKVFRPLYIFGSFRTLWVLDILNSWKWGPYYVLLLLLWTVFTTRCRALWSTIEHFPYQPVTELVRMLSLMCQ